MNQYFATFIPGLQELVAKVLKKELRQIQVQALSEGLVVFRSPQSFRKIVSLSFFNNSFYCLFWEKNQFPIEKLIKVFLANSSEAIFLPREILARKKTFRIMASVQSRLVSLPKKLLKKGEDLFSSQWGLAVDRSLPDLEAWFLTRREGASLVGVRLTKKASLEKRLHPGELRPELVNLMGHLADLQPKDILLDPFAGYGAIPLGCARFFSSRGVIAGEKNKAVLKILKSKVKQEKTRIRVYEGDGLKLRYLADCSVDKIITDPPWGIYESQNRDWEKFYFEMLESFQRVLKPGGKMVILTAQRSILEKLVNRFPDLFIEVKYNLLVSGKKAGLYKLE
ncbi:methyltransferase [Patescibacteria group bacterium]